MAEQRTRYRLNAPGDFYVEDGCCASCGVPAVTAPALFGGFMDDGKADASTHHCWVKQQPRSRSELDAMIATMATQEAGCIRYAGTDAAIIARLDAIGGSDQVDARRGIVAVPDTSGEPPPCDNPPDAAGRLTLTGLMRSFLDDNPHRLLLWGAVGIATAYLVSPLVNSPTLATIAPVVGIGFAWTAALIAAWIAGARAERTAAADAPASGAGLSASGLPGPLTLASTERIDRLADVAADVLARVVGSDDEALFVSDESTLWELHGEVTNEPYVARIRELYGVDVTDIADGPLVDILERIAARWPASTPPMPPNGYAPGS